MSYFDELNQQTLLLIAAMKDPDPEAQTRAYEAAWKSDVDVIHIAMHIAAILAPGVPQELLEQDLTVAAAAVAADFPDEGELLYPSPRGRRHR